MKYLTILLTLVSSLAFGNGIDDKCPQHTIYGAPAIQKEDLAICHTGYGVQYNNQTRVPYYVVEHITKDKLNGKVARGNDFREDPAVPAAVRSVLADYAASGYDRGHMAPAADFSTDAKLMSESFFLSNMMPQAPGNNRGVWKYLEEQTRAIALKSGDVYVITGTIFDANPKMIGKTAVPSKVYKIVVDPRTGKMLSHLFPNEKVDPKDIDKYAVSVKSIEVLTGINYNPKIPANLAAQEDVKTTLKDW